MTDFAPVNLTTTPHAGRLEESVRTYSRVSSGDAASAGTGSHRDVDRVEVSALATYLSKLRQLPPVRQELVDRVRDEIARGVYETPDKLHAAVEELSRDL